MLVLTALAVIGAALPSALTLTIVTAVVGNKLATNIESRRLAQLLREINQDQKVVKPSQTAVDAWVREACGEEALLPFDVVEIAGQQLRATQTQVGLLATYLDDADDSRLRPLLTKLVVQTMG